MKTSLNDSIYNFRSLGWWLNLLFSYFFNALIGCISGQIWISCVVDHVPTMSCKASNPTKASEGTQARTQWTFTLPKRSLFNNPISGILIHRIDGFFYFEPPKSPEKDRFTEVVSPLTEGPKNGSRGILVKLFNPSREEIQINLSTVSFKEFGEHSCAKFKFSYL